MADHLKPGAVHVSQSTPATTHRSADYKVYYSNQSRIRMSASDLQLYFGMLVDNPNQAGVFSNEELLSVILAPQHAKILALTLGAAIAAYEQTFGAINLPPDALQNIQNIQAALPLAVAQATKKPS